MLAELEVEELELLAELELELEGAEIKGGSGGSEEFNSIAVEVRKDSRHLFKN